MFYYNRLHTIKTIFKLIGGGIKVIDLDNIVYIECFSHIQKVYMKESIYRKEYIRCIEIRESLNELLRVFERVSFGQFVSPYIRIHYQLAKNNTKQSLL